MSAYAPDTYRVALFDRMGGRLETLTADSYTAALALGRSRIGASHSFAISRVLFNSLTPTLDNYDPKPRSTP